MATTSTSKNTTAPSGEPADAIDAQIRDAIDMSSAIDDDSLEEAATTAAKSLRAVSALKQEAKKSFDMSLVRGSQAMAEGERQARESVPGVGPRGSIGVDFQLAQQAAVDDFRRSVQRRMVDDLGAKFADRAATMAGKCVDACRSFDDAIAKRVADECGPFAGTRDASLEALLVEERLVARLQQLKVPAIAKTWNDAKKFGDKDQLRALVSALPRALAPFLDQPKALTAAKLAQRSPGEQVEVGTHLNMARMLLLEAERVKVDLMPTAIVEAAQVNEAIKAIFATLVGVDVRRLPPPAFREHQARVLSGQPLDPWEISSDWPVRDVAPRPPLPWTSNI